MDLTVESDSISAAGRAVGDIGAAAILGGNLFARIGMHPALADISDPAERGQVLNRSWRRYGAVNGLSLAAVVVGWAGARADEASPAMLSPTERKLAVAKDMAVVAVTVTGVATAIAGVAFAESEPDGAVPVEDGSHPSSETPDQAAKLKRALNGLGLANMVSALALVSANAALSQVGHRRPPARRLLRRRY